MTLGELHELMTANRNNPSEASKQAMRTRIGDLAIRLSTPHFRSATNAQLFLLLRVACVGNASGAAHIGTHALRTLQSERIPVMPYNELVESALFLAKRQRYLPAQEASATFTLLIEQLLAHDTTDPKTALSIPLDESMQLLEHFRRDKDFPSGYALEFLKKIMTAMPSRKHEILPAHVATICQSVCWWKFADRSAVDFFVDAVDVCLKNVDALSARDASFILDAFATVGYKHTRLFLTLGQHVGDMGEDLVDADAARVIRAFEKTNIDFGNLRVALESAMRLKRVFRRHDRGFEDRKPRRGHTVKR